MNPAMTLSYQVRGSTGQPLQAEPWAPNPLQLSPASVSLYFTTWVCKVSGGCAGRALGPVLTATRVCPRELPVLSPSGSDDAHGAFLQRRGAHQKGAEQQLVPVGSLP